MALPSFLQHVQVLEESGLVRSRKIGRVRTCEVKEQKLRAAESWIAAQRAALEGRRARAECASNVYFDGDARE
jgi:DNA-binding transcriptional ArsR family regulator